MPTNTDLIQDLLKRVAEQGALITRLETATRSIQDAAEKRNDALTEEIHELRTELRVLVERDARREAELADRKVADEKRRQEIVELQKNLAASRQETAVLKQQLTDHVKQVEVWDGRRWAMFIVLVGAVLSLAAGLVVALAKK